jgi:hypothetical protein
MGSIDRAIFWTIYAQQEPNEPIFFRISQRFLETLAEKSRRRMKEGKAPHTNN